MHKLLPHIIGLIIVIFFSILSFSQLMFYEFFRLQNYLFSQVGRWTLLTHWCTNICYIHCWLNSCVLL